MRLKTEYLIRILPPRRWGKARASDCRWYTVLSRVTTVPFPLIVSLEKGPPLASFFPVAEEEAVIETEAVEKFPTGNERILIVDDEESMVEIGRRRLERLGYQVEARTNPIEALELFRAAPDQFDLVITDMTMPHITGDRLVKEILKIRPDMPTILCTGFSEKIDEEKAKEIGVRQYIEKPFDKGKLSRLVRKVLDHP